MPQGPQEIEVPAIELRHSTTDEYCRALQRCRHNAFWAYHATSRLFGNFGRPYQDREGRWWYQMRPGFSWPADVFEAFVPRSGPPLRRAYLGYQHLIPDESAANCRLAINSIFDLPAYGVHALTTKRRNAIRKGLRACEIVRLDTPDPKCIHGALTAWKSLVGRTGWRSNLHEGALRARLMELLDLPAATVLLALDRQTGEVAGFLITKVFGDTAYVDTIASNSALLASNPNDALMYTFLRRAATIPGVNKAHYAIKSNVEALEHFKTTLGFEPTPRPARWTTPPGVKTLIRIASPTMYNRLMGRL